MTGGLMTLCEVFLLACLWAWAGVGREKQVTSNKNVIAKRGIFDLFVRQAHCTILEERRRQPHLQHSDKTASEKILAPTRIGVGYWRGAK